MLLHRRVLVFLAFLFPAAAFPGPTPTVYEVIDLGALPSTPYSSYAVAWSINNRGEVVGNSTTSNGNQHAFLYRDGYMSDIGGSIGAPYSAAYDINSAGDVVGEFGLAGGPQAFLYRDGTTIDLGALAGASNSSAQAINAHGQVVGYVHIIRHQAPVAFLYDKGEIRLLGVLPGGVSSLARDINDAGDIVGYSDVSGIGSRAFLYSKGSMIDIGALTGSTHSVAWGINNKGQVVGERSSPLGVRAFLFDRDVVLDLGADHSAAFDINERGQVVGYRVDINAGGRARAFLYSDGTITDLNDLLDQNSGSGWVLENAAAINDAGEIVGWGMFNGEGFRAFLLTPRANTH